jgi:hypothetical protein
MLVQNDSLWLLTTGELSGENDMIPFAFRVPLPDKSLADAGVCQQ